MNEKLIILGGGESGVGAALLGKAKGYDVFVSDAGNIKPKFQEKLKDAKIEFESGSHNEERILNADLIVKSPGIPQKAPLIQKLRAANVKIVSEIEFASWFTQKPIIAITGSNGKTTTTSLIAHMLRKAGKKVGLGGNIGYSFAELVLNDKEQELYVLELSSFQLDDIDKFKPHVAILLNITPDHLDQYDYDIDKYGEAKLRIAENQTEEDFFIYNVDDPKTVELLKKHTIKAKMLGYSLKDENQPAYADKENLILTYPETFRMKLEELALLGEHNVSNSLASALNGNILKLRKKIIQESLTDFDAVEHRLEPVLSVRGIEFINDSKATNINATFYALQSMKKPTIWIVGGKDKGNDYSELIPLVKKKVKAIVCLGVDNSKIVECYRDIIPNITETKSMEEAVKTAYEYGENGDTVLLSPACASFDLFDNYEQRGKLFKAEVKKL
ncbi:UDP-N-acetylmuramoyl-L-alanine--D-glutamate ligase [Ornithobacterium rhinotracheale]|uniref:UDP-N-acetylmuramoyl-L-alanine--D-glutamate ligase n=1 Tax=Ornithobacterium rhinotracheale TaxID=28251 RepID=UPI00129CC74A|nr:UDP-N-acetylmuramoyl-L-alanine--D-glutamate ligase [Ornithobacterium rhinotracheale]MRJ08815.1 UDP-N-acetylmuramoyl-L-alanine--D-glutamate ligase [Ornithobacterium rhinotracheale]MRJ09996.1 UDP-N-acetylmuramoyl-L-alanine--D-glutamate ligase [Ornithobacterium rhinotracheale]UOH77698.1 UDP-N-acetylmuramoyl-L-alanine--D-glutamate ligase [Ornithobacterium rhinotracheale]